MDVKKHRKKEKKQKKSKKRRKEKESSSSESASSSESEWTEAPTKQKHDEWMESESFVSTYGKSDLLSRSAKRKQQAEEAALENKRIYEQRELNPYMRKDGKDTSDDRHFSRSHQETSRFKAPRDDADYKSKDSSYSSSSSHKPSWMKKGFVKETDTSEKAMSSSAHDDKQRSVQQDKLERSHEKMQEMTQVVEAPKESHSGASSNDEDQEEVSQLPEDLVLNQNELNYLAARMLRARLEGDNVLCTKIKIELDAAKEKRADFIDSGERVYDGAPRENVLEKKINAFPLPKSLKGKYHKGKKDRTVYVGHLRTSHYDSDTSSLSHMFEREKMTTVDDHMKMYLDAASVSKESLDDECDADVSGKIAKKLNSQPSKEHDIRSAIFDHKKRSEALKKCRFCVNQPAMLKHTIISKGEHVYLCAPSSKSLVEGHGFIVPIAHVSSTLLMDENEYSEIQAYKRGLMKMFGDKGKCVVFMETSYRHKSFPHASIEYIPMPKDVGDLAPMYFKKAIDESEYEWAHNKKLIDLSKKGVRYSVPKALPFFSVEFGLQDGFAHVIEDERNFPHYFGKEIVGGMLEIDTHDIVKYRKESTHETCKKVLKLADQWWKYKDYFTV